MAVDVLQDPAVKKAYADATTLGQQLVADAHNFGAAVVAHVSGAAQSALPDISAAALATFYDFIPGAGRGIVQGLVGSFGTGAIAAIDAEGAALIKQYAGVALLRLNALFAKL